MNFYELLGIPRSATSEEIRRAFRQAAQRLHPDKNVRPGDTELFLEVSKAYEILSDPQQRATYDAELETLVTDAVINEALIRMNFVHGRQNVLVHLEPQMHYMLLEILPPKDPDFQRAPINLCVLIDKSTSMLGERMDRVRHATMSILQSLTPNDTASIVSFSDRAEVIVRPEQARELNVARARLSQIQPGGGTEIAKALQTGLAQVRSRMTEASVNHLILITDGRTYGDEQVCIDMATKAAADRITINTIGIGVDWSDDLLDEVSRISGGNTVYMDSPSTLGDLTKQIMNSLRHVAAVQVQVDAKIAKNINLRSSYRIHPDPLPLNNTFPMLLGHLPSNGKISVLMEWLLDPIGESGIMTLAEFQVSSGAMPAEMSNSPLIATSRIPVSDQEDPSPPPSEILSAVSAMTLYRLQERARQEVKTGHVQDAVQRLERIASHLFRMGEQTLANIALSEARTLKQSHRFSERGEKALKYGSRALLQSPPREKP